mgnify:CR=1 FL=1
MERLLWKKDITVAAQIPFPRFSGILFPPGGVGRRSAGLEHHDEHLELIEARVVFFPDFRIQGPIIQPPVRLGGHQALGRHGHGQGASWGLGSNGRTPGIQHIIVNGSPGEHAVVKPAGTLYVRAEQLFRFREASLEDVKEAARIVHADPFISKIPGGYDAPVTERGSTLSAGQRQLLSFARTLAYKPAILVLDEATANIDTETEALITQALSRLMEGRTTIMVAHRLSTIQHADKIIVMHKGRIEESGSHQELLSQNGLYKKLYDLQLV